MQAINHVATALILKKKFATTPLFGLILAVEAVEYVWVGLNLIGIEQTIIDKDMRSIADVHLVHMPFSHSIVTSLILGVSVGLFILWRGGRAASALALAIALGIVSHVLLDMLVHAPDIALAPFFGGEKYGTGLYANLPPLALAVETFWGVFCWWVYRGNWKLLGLMAILGITSIPFYSTIINTGEAALGGQSTTFALVILGQMLATSCLVWLLAGERRAT